MKFPFANNTYFRTQYNFTYVLFVTTLSSQLVL